VRILLFLALMGIGAQAFAEETRKPVQVLISYGSEYRPERDLENQFVGHNLTNYALGTGHENYVFILERAVYKESSGNATLNVERVLEDTLFWAHRESETWNLLVPFFGGGIGAYQEKITTNLLGADSSTRSSNYKLLGGLNFGIRFDIPVLWLSLEARLLFGDQLDQQPTTGGVIRLGLHF